MDYRVEIDPKLPIIVVTTSGRPEVTKFEAYSVEASRLQSETGLSRVLIDHRKMAPEFGHVRLAEVNRNAAFMTGFREKLARLRMATVVDATVHFGIIRMWESLVENQDIELCHRTFYDVEEARAWLMSSEAQS